MAPHGTMGELEPACLPSGTEVGDWRVLEWHGKGAYGAVYRVERVGEGGAEPCALKLALHPMDPRFEREVELLSRIHEHPHVPRLRDRGLWAHPAGPFPFLVMEWVHGVPLYEWAEGRDRTSRQVLRVLAQVARALEATHGVGGLHRDVKGANVRVRPEDGRAMLLDFGAGDILGARPLTREVLPPGTAPYRSPEALRFQWLHWRKQGAHYEPSPTDDVYALGVTAYRLVTGSYPAPGVEPEVGSFMYPELAGLIRQMLAEEPSARGSAARVATALEKAAETAGRRADLPMLQRSARETTGSPRPVRMWRRGLVAAVAVIAVLAFCGWWATSWRWAENPGREGEDAGTAGLAKDSLTLRAPVERPEPTPKALSLEMPKKPLPGQARPPCKREVEINGGCWVRPEDSKPPCSDVAYEWRGVCYYPVLVPKPPATSEPR
ncbi:serine/threonine protein kinase [Hyalangium rubrum]|uniref:non-specific serine/threonine protein kinase n=1 Tax=Hyalangium rubrum TaxID=3103134 RepID=A0ABU5HH70_9BACT|nr:serine/threonine-protein kinase [Hyalangium sp. s54d21]MDY7232182.1 serine/threonine-protein kinase [Hyalangium sp. s54d21]